MCLIADRRRFLKFLKPVRFTLKPITAYKMLKCMGNTELSWRCTPFTRDDVNVKEVQKALGQTFWLPAADKRCYELYGGYIHCFAELEDALQCAGTMNVNLFFTEATIEVWEVRIPPFTRYVVSNEAAMETTIAAKRIKYIKKVG